MTGRFEALPQALVGFLRTPVPPEEVVKVTLLAFFLAMALGYVASVPPLTEAYLRSPELAFRADPGMYRFYSPEAWARESLRIFGNNLVVFGAFALVAWAYPKGAAYGLVLLAAKTGLLAAPYHELALNLLPYTAIALVTGLGEFTAYALAVGHQGLWGLVLLFAWAWLEAYLIFWGL